MRLHIVMLLVMCQVVFPERLVLQLATGGRGIVSVTNLLDPWITAAVVLFPFWNKAKPMLNERYFRSIWLPYLLLVLVLPMAGVLFNDYPARTLLACWNAIIPWCLMVIGMVGVREAKDRTKVVENYFMAAVFLQLGLAVIQMMGLVGFMPGPLRAIYEWDFHFKSIFLSENVILGRSTGFYLNPNSLGIWGITAFWAGAFLLKGRKRWVGVTAAFLTVILSQSRGSLFALTTSLMLYGMARSFIGASLEDRRRALNIWVVLVAMFVIVVAMPGLMDSIMTGLSELPVVGGALARYTSGAKVVSEGAGADANFTGRVQFWMIALEYLKQHPFGTLGSPELYIGYPADNQFILALEQGSLALFSAVLLMFFGGIRLIGSSLEAGRLVAVVSIAVAVNSISATPLTSPAVYLYWLCIGVYVASLHTRRLETVELTQGVPA